MRIRDGNNSDPGSGIETIRIRDPGWKKVGSGINIPDPQHCIRGGSKTWFFDFQRFLIFGLCNRQLLRRNGGSWSLYSMPGIKRKHKMDRSWFWEQGNIYFSLSKIFVFQVFMASCDKQVKCWDLASNQAIQVYSVTVTIQVKLCILTENFYGFGNLNVFAYFCRWFCLNFTLWFSYTW